MKYEARLRKLEQVTAGMPERENCSHLSNDELNERILEGINRLYGSWDGFLAAAARCPRVPAWGEIESPAWPHGAAWAAMVVGQLVEAERAAAGRKQD